MHPSFSTTGGSHETHGASCSVARHRTYWTLLCVCGCFAGCPCLFTVAGMGWWHLTLRHLCNACACERTSQGNVQHPNASSYVMTSSVWGGTELFLTPLFAWPTKRWMRGWCVSPTNAQLGELEIESCPAPRQYGFFAAVSMVIQSSTSLCCSSNKTTSRRRPLNVSRSLAADNRLIAEQVERMQRYLPSFLGGLSLATWQDVLAMPSIDWTKVLRRDRVECCGLAPGQKKIAWPSLTRCPNEFLFVRNYTAQAVGHAPGR